jgi:tRNA (uracil-5-)-methyltransferase
MKKIVKKFEKFVRECGLGPFNHVSHQGHWKQLTVRTSRTGEILLWAILHPQNLTQSEKDDLKKKLIESFVDNVNDDPSIKVTSLHVQFLGQREKGKI